jgi:hypothetical protein
MPELLRQTPIMECDDCGGLMQHFHATTFYCHACGCEWKADQTAIAILDNDLCAISRMDGDAIYHIEEVALNPRPLPVGADPDQYPDLSDLIATLPLNYYVSDRMVIAWAAWRQSLDQLEATA